MNFPSGGISCSHAIPFTCWNSSSNVTALNSPIFRRTLSAVRSHRLLFTMALSSPIKVIFPFSEASILYPKFCISRFTTASRPKVAVAINSNFKCLSPFVYKLFLTTLYFSTFLLNALPHEVNFLKNFAFLFMVIYFYLSCKFVWVIVTTANIRAI